MSSCPCGSQHPYEGCCGLYIEGNALPKTPEALMRSRYTAYTQANIAYIKKTMKGKPLQGFNAGDAARWARHVQWMGLQVLKAEVATDQGTVEFIASYLEGDSLQTMHEVSRFKRSQGRWFYVGGFPETPRSGGKRN